jgi:hypothetical protein
LARHVSINSVAEVFCAVVMALAAVALVGSGVIPIRFAQLLRGRGDPVR